MNRALLDASQLQANHPTRHLCSLSAPAASLGGDDDVEVTCCEFDRQGKHLAVGTSDGGLLIWDFVTQGVALVLDGNDGEGVTSVSWGRSGRRLITTSGSGPVRVWQCDPPGVEREIVVDGATDGERAVVRAEFHPKDENLCLLCRRVGDPLLVLLPSVRQIVLATENADATTKEAVEVPLPMPAASPSSSLGAKPEPEPEPEAVAPTDTSSDVSLVQRLRGLTKDVDGAVTEGKMDAALRLVRTLGELPISRAALVASNAGKGVSKTKSTLKKSLKAGTGGGGPAREVLSVLRQLLKKWKAAIVQENKTGVAAALPTTSTPPSLPPAPTPAPTPTPLQAAEESQTGPRRRRRQGSSDGVTVFTATFGRHGCVVFVAGNDGSVRVFAAPSVAQSNVGDRPAGGEESSAATSSSSSSSSFSPWSKIRCFSRVFPDTRASAVGKHKHKPRRSGDKDKDKGAVHGTGRGPAIEGIRASFGGQWLLLRCADRVLRLMRVTLPSSLNDAQGAEADSRAAGAEAGHAKETERRSAEVAVVPVVHATPVCQVRDGVDRARWSSCTFSPDGEYFVAGSARLSTVHIWNVVGQRVQTLSEQRTGFCHFAWHPRRPCIAAVSATGKGVSVWDKPPAQNWTAFAPNFEAVSGDNVVYAEREDEFDLNGRIDLNGRNNASEGTQDGREVTAAAAAAAAARGLGMRSEDDVRVDVDVDVVTPDPSVWSSDDDIPEFAFVCQAEEPGSQTSKKKRRQSQQRGRPRGRPPSKKKKQKKTAAAGRGGRGWRKKRQKSSR